MFEGLLAPWHLLILAAVLLLVLGPQKIADRFHGIMKGVQHIGEPRGGDAAEEPGDASADGPIDHERRSLAYRLGRRFRRRR